MAKKRKNESTPAAVVVNQIKVAQLNRNRVDIGNYQQAVRTAESITNPRRKALYELYNNVSSDLHLDSIVRKRINAVRTAPIMVECEDESRKEAIEQMLRTPWFYELIGYIMEARFWGHSLVELQLEDGEIAKAILIPRPNVVPERGIVAYDATNPSEGIPYREEPYNRYLLEVGKPDDLGLLMKLAPYVIYKRGNLADFAQFNELFGMPIREYQYDPHSPGSRQEVMQQAEAQGSAAYIVMPKGTQVELHQASGISGAATFKDFHSIMNQEMSIGVLGQDLTTSNSGTGSYSLGSVHKDVEEAINLEDKIWVTYILNWDFKWMLEQLGWNMEGVELRFDDAARLDVKTLMDILIRLAPFMPIPLEEVFNILNLPQPSEQEVKAWREQKGAAPVQLSAKAAAQPTDSFGARLALLYKDAPFRPSKPITLAAGDEELTAIIERIIQQLHAGELRAGDVDEELARLLSAELYAAVVAGFGASLEQLEVGAPDYNMLKALRENVHVFSGAKTYQQLRQMAELLVDDAGQIRSFADFREEALKLHRQYNQNWLYTEYTQAVGNSQIARKWLDIEAQKDALPYLQLRVVMDENTRHGQWNKVTLPVDHPAWDYLTPLLDWGCRCTLVQLAEAPVSRPNQVPEPDVLKPEFRFNPGKEQAIFSKRHPYFEVQRADRARLANNFGLTAPD